MPGDRCHPGGSAQRRPADQGRRHRDQLCRSRSGSLQPVPIEPPAYITSEQLLRGARRPPASAPTRSASGSARRRHSADRLPIGCPDWPIPVSERSSTNRVLVCADSTDSSARCCPARLGICRHMLVIAAPTIDADALQAIIANKLAGKLHLRGARRSRRTSRVGGCCG